MHAKLQIIRKKNESSPHAKYWLVSACTILLESKLVQHLHKFVDTLQSPGILIAARVHTAYTLAKQKRCEEATNKQKREREKTLRKRAKKNRI